MQTAGAEKKNLKSNTSRGTGKGLIQRAIDRLSTPQVDWRSQLKRIIGKMVLKNEDYFGKRKHLYADKYIYGNRAVDGGLKDAIMAVDTSGSMGDNELKTILSEIAGIIKAKKIHKTEIVYFDDGIQNFDYVRNPPNFNWEKATGGGGTSFIEPVEYINTKFKKNRCELAVFCTDGYGDQNQLDPKFKFAKKFVWVIIDNPGFVAPFSQQYVVHITSKSKK
jgi:predicted metal-dependent peptidase